MTFYILINSYKREKKCYNLIEGLTKELDGHSYYIQVYLDGVDYSIKHGKAKYTLVDHHGKNNYYRLVEMGFQRAKQADYFIKIDDDMEVKPDFFKKALTAWESIEDKNKIALNLLKDQRDHLWGSGPAEKINNLVSKTNWVDLNFMMGKEFYELRHLFRFEEKPEFIKSSGVGRQFCRTLRRFGTIYQVNESLLIHGDHESKMNPERKEKLTDI